MKKIIVVTTVIIASLISNNALAAKVKCEPAKFERIYTDKALVLQNIRSIGQGRGVRWGSAGPKSGLLPTPRIEGLYKQAAKGNGLTLFQLRDKTSGQRLLRVEKGLGRDGGPAFWHKHNRPGFKHHRPIFPWDKGRF